MAIDASIPLSIRPPQFMQPAEAMSLRQVSMQMQEQERKQQEQNELKKVLQDPQSLDPKTGNITTIGLNKISQINPITSMQIQQQQDQRMAQQVTRRMGELQLSERQAALITEDMTGLYAVYQDMGRKNIPTEQASARFRESLAQKIRERETSGLFTPEQIEGMRRINSPDQVPGVLMGSKAYRESIKPKTQVVAAGSSITETPAEGGTPRTIYTAPQKDEGAWSDPYQLGGAWVERNASSGQTRQVVSRPPVTNVNMPKLHYDPDRGVIVDLNSGKATAVQAGGKDLGPRPVKISDAAVTAGGYADRMVASEKILKETEASGKPTVMESAAATLPAIGKVASNVARSPERQKYRQAQEDWVRAKLRKESGAVIADEEMDREIRTYFPQLGDGPAVVAQKAQARAVSIQAMLDAAERKQRVSDKPGGTLKFDAQGNLQ